jgi:O-antigen ligase
MILVALNSRSQRVFSRPLLAVAGVVFTAALILSGSRASLVALVVAGCVFLSIRARNTGDLLFGFLMLLGVAVVAVHMALPGYFTHYWERLGASLHYALSSPDGVLSGRVSTWKTIAKFLLSHPWHAIFGIGYKTMPYTDYLGAPVVADNTYLSLLVETGIAGLATFLLLNAAILRTAFRARATFFGAWIFCFWCGEMVQMLSGDLITYWRVLPIYFWVLAIAARKADA